MSKLALLWDIDGVLVMSEPLHREKIEAIAADPFGTGKPDPETGVTIHAEDWSALHGKGDHGIYDWVKQKNPAYPLLKDEFLKACADYYLDNASSLQPREGALEVVEYAHSLGIPQAAVSSGVRPQVDANLSVAGFDKYMLFSISADDVAGGQRKPHPYPYLKGIEYLRERVEAVSANLRNNTQIVTIEDSASGVESGKRAETTAVYWKLEEDQKDSAFADVTVTPEQDFVAIMKNVISGP